MTKVATELESWLSVLRNSPVRRRLFWSAVEVERRRRAVRRRDAGAGGLHGVPLANYSQRSARDDWSAGM